MNSPLKWQRLGKFINFYKIETTLFILLTRKRGMYLQKRNCIGCMAQISAGTLIFLQAKSKVGKGDIWSYGRQMRQIVFHCSKLFGQKIFFPKHYLFSLQKLLIKG